MIVVNICMTCMTEQVIYLVLINSIPFLIDVLLSHTLELKFLSKAGMVKCLVVYRSSFQFIANDDPCSLFRGYMSHLFTQNLILSLTPKPTINLWFVKLKYMLVLTSAYVLILGVSFPSDLLQRSVVYLVSLEPVFQILFGSSFIQRSTLLSLSHGLQRYLVNIHVFLSMYSTFFITSMLQLPMIIDGPSWF